PVGALAACILGARNPDAGGIVQQQVPAVRGGVDPLGERLLETLVAVGNVLGGAPCTRRRHSPGERAKHLMTEMILRRHRSRLLRRNAVEGCITHNADLAMLEAEAGDQFCRGLGGQCRRGQQQKACDRSANCTTCHRPPKWPLLAKPRLYPAASPSAMWTLQGRKNTTLFRGALVGEG